MTEKRIRKLSLLSLVLICEIFGLVAYGHDTVAVVAAIEQLKSQPQWQHLDPSIVTKVAEQSNFGPELNATVQVVDAAGKPVAECLVVVCESENERWYENISPVWAGYLRPSLPLAIQVTNEKGTASFERVRRRQPELQNRGRDKTIATAQVVVISDQFAWNGRLLESTDSLQEITIVLGAPHQVVGRVLGPNGPVSGATILVGSWSEYPQSNSNSDTHISVPIDFSPKSISDESGFYRLNGLPREGWVTMGVWHPRLGEPSLLRQQMSPFKLGSERIDFEFSGHEQPDMRFRLVDSKTWEPIPSGAIELWNATVAVREDGTFEIPRGYCCATKEGSAVAHFRILPPTSYVSNFFNDTFPKAEQRLDIPVVKGMQLRGKVKDAVTGKGIPDVVVRTREVDSGLIYTQSKSNEEGSFFTTVPASNLNVIIDSCVYGYEIPIPPAGRPRDQDGHGKSVSQTDPISRSMFASFSSSNEIEFSLNPIKPIQGTVYDDHGNPIPNAPVVACTSMSWTAWKSSTLTDPMGNFTVMPPPGVSGSVLVIATFEGGSFGKPVEINSVGSYSGESMNLRMDATTILMSIVGTLAIDKKPANGVLVSLDLNSREVVALDGLRSRGIEYPVSTSLTDALGRFEFLFTGNNRDSFSLNVISPASMRNHMLGYLDMKLNKLRTELPPIHFRTAYGDESIAGEIVTPDGDSVVGAWIKALPQNREVPILKLNPFGDNESNADTAVTDEQGNFVCRNLSVGYADLQLRLGKKDDPWAIPLTQFLKAKTGHDYVHAVMDPTLASPPTRVEPLETSPRDVEANSFAVTGRVLGPDGPIRGYAVCMSLPKSPITYRVATNEEGIFRFDRIGFVKGLVKGDSEFCLSGDIRQSDRRGWLNTHRVQIPSPGEMIRLPDLELAPAASLSVHIVGEDGMPLPVEVSLECSLRQSAQSVNLKIDKDASSATFHGLPTEPLIIYAIPKGKYKFVDLHPTFHRVGYEHLNGFAMDLSKKTEVTISIWPR